MKVKPYTFIYNPDLSGSVTIINSLGKEFMISGGHLKKFIAELIKQSAVAKLESAPLESFLKL